MTGMQDRFDVGMVEACMSVAADRDFGAVELRIRSLDLALVLAPPAAIELALLLVSALDKLCVDEEHRP